jgi:aspartyl-tRNA(Asn)/glutamyl-tRNA(Gln) amidotransferase subunit B|tara:strand:+ start:865 stop:2304 length:1440 start_codon:yes stop_codon:yes gene_type:complete
MEWEVVIGLEIHAQLSCKSKIFSGSSTNFGVEQNTQASLIDLGYPGVLPVLNQEAVVMAIKFGLAVNAQISERSIFARKNYFYPDLPKGYQISQYELPIVYNGSLEIQDQKGALKKIGITRAHLEEDAGKSIHDKFKKVTAIDLNRAGTPLLEIVSEPELSSPEEARAYMQKIHQIVKYLEICDGNMQEGSFRCDANVSLKPKDSNKLGTRTEIKNLNSFKFVEKAIVYEIARQKELLNQGKVIIQETRLYDSNIDETRAMRTKEEENDYRYFPDPDLLPLEIDQSMIEDIRSELPELFEAKVQRYVNDFGVKEDDAIKIANTIELARYFEEVIAQSDSNNQLVASWILTELLSAMNRNDLTADQLGVSPKSFSKLLQRVTDGTISGKIAKEVFVTMIHDKKDVDDIIQSQGLEQISDEKDITPIIIEVLKSFPAQLEEYLNGKEKIIDFFVGQVMQRTQGRANPTLVVDILKKTIKNN